MPSADQLAGTFASFFFDAIVANDLSSVARMFADDASFVLVDGAAQKVYFDPTERSAAILELAASVAASNFVVESVSGADTSNGVSATVMYSVLSETFSQRTHLSVLLEKVDEDVFCVRQLTITLFTPTAAPAPALPIVAAPAEPERVAQAESPERPQPVVTESKPKRTMKKSQKAAPAAAPPVEEVAPPQVPVEEPAVVVETPAPQPVVVEAPKEVKQAAPAVQAAPADSKPTSWAKMAREHKSAQPHANHVPIRVSPPPEGGVVPEPVAAAVEQPAAAIRPSRAPREPRAPAAEVLDKVMFGVAKVVTEEEVKEGLGSLAASVVSLRIVPDKKLVFIDFSVDDALVQLREKPPTYGGVKINAYKQKPKE